MQLRKISEQARWSTHTLTTDQLKFEVFSHLVDAHREKFTRNPPMYWEGLKPEGLAINLADCVIEILGFCERHNIDLEWAIKMSLDYRRSKQGE